MRDFYVARELRVRDDKMSAAESGAAMKERAER